MFRILYKNLTNSIPRKLLSLIIGYHVWVIVGSYLPTYHWLEVPLCFYNTTPETTWTAPESIRVLLAGQRATLRNLDTTSLAIHIDTRTLASDHNRLMLSDYELLLPPHVHVVDWAPSNIIITKQPSEHTIRTVI